MTSAPRSGGDLHDALRRALQPGTSLVHPTYRHLQRRIVLAGLSWSQWLALTATGATAWLIAQLLPLPEPWNLSVAVLLPGIPAIALWALSADGDINAYAMLRGALRWRRDAGTYLPIGPTPDRTRGYGPVDPNRHGA